MILVDTGPLYAYVDATDQHHQQALDLFRNHRGPLLVPTLVIPEVVYLLASRLGSQAESRFLSDLASGDFSVEPVEPTDWPRIAHLVLRYQDLPLGTVDASIVALGERLGVHALASFDRRHFTVVRPAHIDSFDLLP